MRRRASMLCCVLSSSVVAASSVLGAAPAATLAPLANQDPPAPTLQPGPAKQIKDLSWMVGKWDVHLVFLTPGGQSMTQEVTATIEKQLDGCFLVESLAYDVGGFTLEALGYRSYDQIRETYRIVWFDSLMGLADVCEGTVSGHSLKATNLRVNTSFPLMTGGLANGRFTPTKVSDAEFTIAWDYTTDGGKTWVNAGHSTYNRK